jgi:hypothetical protein
MVAMMECDSALDPREIGLIGDIYEEIVGFRLEASVRSKLIGSVSTSQEEVLELLESRRQLLDADHRRRVLRGGLRVLQADNRMHPREWRLLRDVGLALGFTDDEIDALLAMS